jgi:hypothetical protein
MVVFQEASRSFSALSSVFGCGRLHVWNAGIGGVVKTDDPSVGFIGRFHGYDIYRQRG